MITKEVVKSNFEFIPVNPNITKYKIKPMKIIASCPGSNVSINRAVDQLLMSPMGKRVRDCFKSIHASL